MRTDYLREDSISMGLGGEGQQPGGTKNVGHPPARHKLPASYIKILSQLTIHARMQCVSHAVGLLSIVLCTVSCIMG